MGSMSTDRTRRTGCVDCEKPCRGTRCRPCDGKHRAEVNKLKPRRKRVRQTVFKKRYRPPDPSPDMRPLTREERRDALCAEVGDTYIFFAEQGSGYADAEALCVSCPIAARCLSANLDEEYGFFAASPPARKRIKKRLKAEAARQTLGQFWDAQEVAS